MPNTSAKDLGHIDQLEVTAVGTRLAGDWGEMVIVSELPTLVLRRRDSHT